MKKYAWEKMIEGKYALLLGSLIVLIAAYPLFALNSFAGFILQSFLFIMVIFGMLRVLGAGWVLFLTSGVLAALAVFLHYRALLAPGTNVVAAGASFCYVIVIGITGLFMLRRLFSEKSVTADTVKGGISLYILMGLWWETVYSAMWALDHGSFVQNVGKVGPPDFFYFSFTTLTTLGYGDILPASQYAKIGSTLEAMMGQIYLAVFVARLVGLHIVHSTRHS